MCCPYEMRSGKIDGCVKCVTLTRQTTVSARRCWMFLFCRLKKRSSCLNFQQQSAACIFILSDITSVLIHPSMAAEQIQYISLFLPPLRTTEWTSSWDSSGTTLGWPTASTPTTRWTSTPPCWTPSGNPTCSLPTRRGPTSTRSPPTTSCCASLKTATCSTAYGEWRRCEVWDILFYLFNCDFFSCHYYLGIQ